LLCLQAVLALNDVWVVLSLLAFQQAFFGINSPTRSAAIPRMLPGEQLPAANALNMTVTQFGAVAGPLLARGGGRRCTGRSGGRDRRAGRPGVPALSVSRSRQRPGSFPGHLMDC